MYQRDNLDVKCKNKKSPHTIDESVSLRINVRFTDIRNNCIIFTKDLEEYYLGECFESFLHEFQNTPLLQILE